MHAVSIDQAAYSYRFQVYTVQSAFTWENGWLCKQNLQRLAL